MHNNDDSDDDNNEEAMDIEDANDDDDALMFRSAEESATNRIIQLAALAYPQNQTRNVIRQRRNNSTSNHFVSSIKHGGCINTVAWLDTQWRLSIVDSTDNEQDGISSNSYSSNSMIDVVANCEECPTQMCTSGDDRLVKFWDVRHAMGTNSPLPGGRNTQCPFAYTAEMNRESGISCVDSTLPNGIDPNFRKNWKTYYERRKNATVSGNVIALSTLATGHRGNVFHVTPLKGQPGKVATCGADGYLRVSDVNYNMASDNLNRHYGSSTTTNSSTIVVSPEYDDDSANGRLGGSVLSMFSNPGMCFSHHFVTQNMGLLCSERGLRWFDLRLAPREQNSTSILGFGPWKSCCKAVAVWSDNNSDYELESSAYVFAGASSSDVALCDLRMLGGGDNGNTSDEESSRRVVQYYRPRGLLGAENVSVSGLDLSKDRKELLVSYESDQIYSFPIFPNSSSPAGPTVDEVSNLSNNNLDNALPELAAYGGHLNRFTFLKNARYAGPNDEYICTGSDSGHAWIYERATGAVVSFLNADNSTCNGVVPHCTLPIFITYGIDSTAKLWRATVPVDNNADDSKLGRAKCFQESNYDMSPTTCEWDYIQNEVTSVQVLNNATSGEETKNNIDSLDSTSDKDKGKAPKAKKMCNPWNFSDSLLPDQVISRKELIHSGTFGRSMMRRYASQNENGANNGIPEIGNDLQYLNDVLRRNQYECIRSSAFGQDDPVEGNLNELMRRIALIRLKHQADRQGLIWNPTTPWILLPPSTSQIAYCSATATLSKTNEDPMSTAHMHHPADLVPDNPSDWIPYDHEMTKVPMPCGVNFNIDSYSDFYCEKYLNSQPSILLNENGVKYAKIPWLHEASHSYAKMPSSTKTSSSDTMNNTTVSIDDCSGVVNTEIKEIAKGDNTSNKKIEILAVAGLSTNTCMTTSTSEKKKDNNKNVNKFENRAEENTRLPTFVPVVAETKETSPSLSTKFSAAPEKSNSLAYTLLYETVKLLKEGGNEALKAGSFSTAARRYDKSLRYCALAFMQHSDNFLIFDSSRNSLLNGSSNENSNEKSNKGHIEEESNIIKIQRGNGSKSNHKTYGRGNKGLEMIWSPLVKWTPLLKILITTRLNLSMLLLKQQLSQPDRAVEQARLSLRELSPFCTIKKKVMIGSTNSHIYEDEESIETYFDTKALQAKAYFRLGSAQYEIGEFSQAINSLKLSIECTQQCNDDDNPNNKNTIGKPDSLVARRLAEARRENKRKNKRHRRKLKMMFATDDFDDNDDVDKKGKRLELNDANRNVDNHKEEAETTTTASVTINNEL